MIQIVNKFDVGLLKSALKINHALGKYLKVKADQLTFLKKVVKARIMKNAHDNTCTFPGMLSYGIVISNKPVAKNDD